MHLICKKKTYHGFYYCLILLKIINNICVFFYNYGKFSILNIYYYNFVLIYSKKSLRGLINVTYFYYTPYNIAYIVDAHQPMLFSFERQNQNLFSCSGDTFSWWHASTKQYKLHRSIFFISSCVISHRNTQLNHNNAHIRDKR